MENVPKLKEMPPKERPGYIWTYYKWPIIIAIAVVIFLVSFIRGQLTKKEEIVYLIAANSNYMNLDVEDPNVFLDDFVEQQGYDTADCEGYINAALSYDPENATDLYAMQTMQTTIVSGVADVFMSDETLFEFLGGQGDFVELSGYLSEELLEKYEDQIVWCTVEDEESDAEPITYAAGIRLTDSEWVENSGLYPGMEPVIGLLAGGSNEETAQELILYILGEDL